MYLDRMIVNLFQAACPHQNPNGCVRVITASAKMATDNMFAYY